MTLDMDWGDCSLMLKALRHWWLEYDPVEFRYDIFVEHRGVLGTGAFTAE